MKKLVALCVIFVLMFTYIPWAAAQQDEIKVFVDEEQLQFDVPPILENGRLLVPVRAIFEALGAEIEWVEAAQLVKAVRGNTSIYIIIDQPVAGVTDETKRVVDLDVPAKLINGRVLVPVRFVSEALGAEVDWKPDIQTVIITNKSEDEKVKLSIEGEIVICDYLVQDSQDEILLPTDQLLVPIGVLDNHDNFSFNEEEQSIMIRKDDTTIKMQLDSKTAYLNGKKVMLDAAPTINEERLYIPAKFVMESLDKKVVWNASAKAYLVTDVKEYNDVKEILEKSYKAMSGVRKLKTEQTVKVTTSFGEESIAVELISSLQIDKKNKIVSQNVKVVEQIEEEDTSDELQMWIEKDKVYVGQESGDSWEETVIEQDKWDNEQKRLFDLYSFLEANDLLYAGLKVEESKESKAFVVKGNVISREVVDIALNKSELDMGAISNAYMEIHIDKQKYFVTKMIIKATMRLEMGVLSELESTWINSEINGRFKLTTPPSLEKYMKASELKIDEKLAEADQLFDEGKYEEAVKQYDKVISLDPEVADAYASKAVALYYLDRLQESTQSFNKYLELVPDDVDAVIWKARNYIYLRQYDQALSICEEVLDENPRNDFAQNVKGLAYLYAGNYDEAVAAFDKAISIDKKYEDAHMNKIAALYYQKKYLECIDYAKTVEKLFPKNSDVLWFMGNAYTYENKNEEAIQQYKKILILNPDDEGALIELGWQYYVLQDYNEAFKYANKALAINEANESALQLKETLEKTRLPEAQRVVDFVEENYLYYNEVDGFDEKSKAFMEKKEVDIQDIETYIHSIKTQGDIFTFVISGEDYDTLMNQKDEDQIAYKQMDNGAEYIKIIRFTSGVGNEFKKLIDKIEEPEEKVLIIDLRDNMGGRTDASNAILDSLLSECMTSFTIDRSGYIYPYYSDADQIEFKKIIVMVNENSASSSELLSLGLKKYLNNVVIIGQPTVGKGVGQLVYENKKEKYMIYLVNHYWNVKEQNINGGKIIPDIIVEGSEDAEYLEQINKLITN